MLKVVTLTIFCACISGICFTQTSLIPEYDEIYFPGETLKNNKIRSAHVLLEQRINSENGEDYVLSKKRVETEFDKNGLLTYKRNSPLITDYYFGELTPLGGRDTRYYSFVYDDDLRLTEVCSNYNYGTSCVRTKFNEMGKRTSLSYDFDDSDPVMYNFTWSEDGILENVSVFGTNGRKPNQFYGMDTEGKLQRVNYTDGTHLLYSYVDENDTATTYISHYREDSLLTQITQKKFISTDQLFYERKSQGRGEVTLYLKEIEYDEQHQMTRYYFKDDYERIKFHSRNQNTIVDGYPLENEPQTFERMCTVENEYQNGLLIKRTFLFFDKHSNDDEVFYENKEIGTIIERITYEKKPLPSRPWEYEEDEIWDR